MLQNQFQAAAKILFVKKAENSFGDADRSTINVITFSLFRQGHVPYLQKSKSRQVEALS